MEKEPCFCNKIFQIDTNFIISGIYWLIKWFPSSENVPNHYSSNCWLNTHQVSLIIIDRIKYKKKSNKNLIAVKHLGIGWMIHGDGNSLITYTESTYLMTNLWKSQLIWLLTYVISTYLMANLCNFNLCKYQ